MKNIKKLLSLISCILIISIILAGCTGNPRNAAGGNGEPVKIKMYLLGDKPQNYNEIYDKVNEIMKEKIGAYLDIEYISWADQDKKYSLIFAANEDFDLVYSANWSYYTQQAAKNSFLELTDELLKKNNPTSYAEIPQVAWEQAKVNGKVYMIPITGVEFGTHTMGIRGDLREKYNLPPVTSLETLEDYMSAVAKNETTITPWCALSTRSIALMTPNEWDYAGNVGEEIMIGYKINDNSGQIFSIVDTPEYEAYVKRMKTWFENGYWTSDVLSTANSEGISKGRFAVQSHNILSTGNSLNFTETANPEFKVELCDISEGAKKLPLLYTNSGMSVHLTSKKVDKALSAVELLRNDKKLFDLTWYGIEGKHWNSVGDLEYSWLSDDLPAEDQYYAGCVWGWRNEKLWRTDVNMFGNSKETIQKWKDEDMVESMVQPFNFNSEKVKNEIAAVTNVYKQYGMPLEYGFVDPADGLKGYKEKLSQAGLDKIITEMQNQLNEYLNK